MGDEQFRQFYVDELTKLGLPSSGTIRNLQKRYESALQDEQKAANVEKKLQTSRIKKELQLSRIKKNCSSKWSWNK